MVGSFFEDPQALAIVGYVDAAPAGRGTPPPPPSAAVPLPLTGEAKASSGKNLQRGAIMAPLSRGAGSHEVAD